jgi:hypothetical protein
VSDSRACSAGADPGVPGGGWCMAPSLRPPQGLPAGKASCAATLLLTATDGVLGTHSRIATAQPADLTVLCGERDARYPGKGLIADEPSLLGMRRLSRWAQ